MPRKVFIDIWFNLNNSPLTWYADINTYDTETMQFKSISKTVNFKHKAAALQRAKDICEINDWQVLAGSLT